MTQSILDKWNEGHVGAFLRFLDGDKTNLLASNLVWVSLRDAMAHVDDWTCDWDMHLTSAESDLVRTPEWRAGLRLDEP